MFFHALVSIDKNEMSHRISFGKQVQTEVSILTDKLHFTWSVILAVILWSIPKVHHKGIGSFSVHQFYEYITKIRSESVGNHKATLHGDIQHLRETFFALLWVHTCTFSCLIKRVFFSKFEPTMIDKSKHTVYCKVISWQKLTDMGETKFKWQENNFFYIFAGIFVACPP